MLCISSKPDTAAKVAHCINMLHPVFVNILKKNDALNFAHTLGGELLFTCGINTLCYFKNVAYKVVCVIVNAVKLVTRHSKVIIREEDAAETVSDDIKMLRLDIIFLAESIRNC